MIPSAVGTTPTHVPFITEIGKTPHMLKSGPYLLIPAGALCLQYERTAERHPRSPTSLAIFPRHRARKGNSPDRCRWDNKSRALVAGFADNHADRAGAPAFERQQCPLAQFRSSSVCVAAGIGRVRDWSVAAGDGARLYCQSGKTSQEIQLRAGIRRVVAEIRDRLR